MTAATDALKLPASLQLCRLAIEDALGLPVPGAWPEGEPVLKAEQPAALAAPLVATLHRHLTDARIAYLFVEDKREKDRVKLGSAARASTKIRFLADVDYVIEFNWTAWMELTPDQRLALVDHELCKCAGKDDKGRWQEKGYDVQEFTVIIARWGLWKEDVEHFGQVAAQQIEIFGGAR